jgi:hypothetical protein
LGAVGARSVVWRRPVDWRERGGRSGVVQIEVMPVQQLTRRTSRDVAADIVHACAAREAAVSRHDVESVAGLSVWIDLLRAELATRLPAQRGV